MTTAEIYKDVKATNQELSQVLKQLGFKDLSTDKAFHFVHKSGKQELVFEAGNPESPVQKIYFPMFAYRLFMQGIIENEGVLKAMLEKNREKKQAPASQ
ncbi:MAG: hypothetical protein R2830_16675 [Saprospiraceae bacterium]